MSKKRVQKYNIPDKFRTKNFDPKNFSQDMSKTLTKDNYNDRFHELLWVEEWCQLESYKHLEMCGVRLIPDGDLLVVPIPDLEDKTPRLIVGDKISVSDPNQRSRKKRWFQGYIHEIRFDAIHVKFHHKFHYDFHYYFKHIYFRVIFHMSRTTFRRCHHAIDLDKSLLESVLFPDQSILESKPPLIDIKKENLNWINKKLNTQQRRAVMTTLTAQYRPTPIIIFGPPGTGKTITIIESILQVFKYMANSRVLICTSTNCSADLIAEKLLESRVVSRKEFIRVIAYSALNNVTEKLKAVTNTTDKQGKWLKYRIIVITASKSGSFFYEDIGLDHFTHLFIDEAAQITEPEALIPISVCGRGGATIVLAGDHKQLGPTVFSKIATSKELDLSLMERLMTKIDAYRRNDKFVKYGFYDPNFAIKLVKNYRSDPKIMAIPSKLFYDNELVFSSRTDTKLLNAVGYNSPIMLFGVKGTNKQDPGTPSWYNPQEVKLVCHTVENLYHNGVSPKDIAILTPYRKQVDKIKESFRRMFIKECKVSTIEGFQGNEKRIVIISMVKSVDKPRRNSGRTLSFLFDSKRFNVAVSRAKSLLVIIGHPFVLGMDSHWNDILHYCINNNCYHVIDDNQPKSGRQQKRVIKQSKKSSFNVSRELY